jgi:hypothetical protein
MFLFCSGRETHMSATLTANRPAASDPRREAAFPSAEQAWFWTMSALAARHTGASTRDSARIPRPCDPDDVIRALDQLYRQRRIDLVHARILRIWGERGAAPSARHPGQASDARIWREAMDRLDAKLRVRGIVA